MLEQIDWTAPSQKTFTCIVSYNTYDLNKKSHVYNKKLGKFIWKVADRSFLQMRQLKFDPVESISILSFIATLKARCGTNGFAKEQLLSQLMLMCKALQCLYVR